MNSCIEWNVNGICGHKCVGGKYFFKIEWEDSHMTRQEIKDWKTNKPKHIKHFEKFSNNIFLVEWNNTWERQENVSAKLIDEYLSKVRRNELFLLCETEYYQRRTQSAFASALWN
ncbi:MAG: hypothetical protein GY714_02830 [Desulfobacterales bacterium]|nr:hypothetical protein [Desulfobacterales bacterium]